MPKERVRVAYDPARLDAARIAAVISAHPQYTVREVLGRREVRAREGRRDVEALAPEPAPVSPGAASPG